MSNIPSARIIAGIASITLAALSHAQQARDFSKGNTLYVVPYAHLDTQWRWAYPQVIREYIANTLHDNFKLIDKYPNYVFNFSGSRRYEMMREYYPAEYKRLKAYVKAGRWFPCGSSVDESDANVPSGESMIRHVLYGNRFFRKEFGVASEEFMLPDCFGFPYALPTILAHCGIKGFSTQKLTWGSAVGIPFKVGRWEGPDGRSVVAALDPGAYVHDITEDLSQNTSWLARIQNTGKMSGAYVDYHYYGVGDKGGAPTESSVQWAERSIAGKGPVKVISTRADEMFTSFKPAQIAKLPHYKGELLLTEHSAGSITSQAYMKRWNRKSELLADAAERASVAAVALGGTPYPSDRLYQAWDLVLGTQMHDMLPGTSIPKAYEFCWNDYLLALNMFAGVTESAVESVTAAMDTRATGHAVVVYNPLSIPREDAVEVALPSAVMGSVQAYGPDGKAVPTQRIGFEGTNAKYLFLARVPANSFTVFDLRPVPGPRGIAETRGRRAIENMRFKVTVNEAGDIASIYDKTHKREVLKAPARLDLQYHNPRSFPAWNMDWEDAQKPPRAHVGGPAKIDVVEWGPVRYTIEVERETEGSKFFQQIRLYSGRAADRIEVLNKIDWQTRETALKASFPLASGSPKATYDLQVGAIERGNNDAKKYEVPQHQWLDVTSPDRKYGAAILNDSKYGSDKPDDNTVRLTLIYTPGVRGGYRDQATQDIGRHEILYAIAPHGGDWREGNVAWQARRMNQPLLAFEAPKHGGTEGKRFSLANISNRQVEIMAIKKAEDTNEVIVRLRELEGRPARGVELRMPRAMVGAREVDGQERTVGVARISVGALVTDLPAYGLKTFAIKLLPSPTKPPRVASQSVPLTYDVDVASTDASLTDGSFDASGRTFAAEQLPAGLTIDGIAFKLGSTKNGAKNAVTARGQTIQFPAGQSRVYVLAASSAGDVPATFGVGSSRQRVTVQDWGGFIGLWDNRLWEGDLGPNYTNYGEWAGLVPGFVKPAEVAWYSSHRHHPKSGNEFYEYSYLFKYAFDAPGKARSLTLPNDPRIKVFAVSVARGTHDTVRPLMPLYDTLEEHRSTGTPSVLPASGSFNDATTVTMKPPLYWRTGGLRYTLDGSTPTAASSVYKGPMTFSDPVTIKVAEIGPDGKAGPHAIAVLDIKDVKAPSILEATSPKALGYIRVRFSEQVSQESAEQAGNYRLGGARVMTAELRPDLRSVELVLDRPLTAGQRHTLSISGVKDLARLGNAMVTTSVEIAERGAVFSSPDLEAKTSKVFAVENLPVRARDAWTVNFFCRVDAEPEDRTIIAGFGRASDGRTGTGRYFAKFPGGLNFWAANRDTRTRVQLDLGTWQMLTAAYDGETMRLYKNGELIAEQKVELADDQAQARIMPPDAWERRRVFQGEVRDFTIWDLDLSPSAIKKLWEAGKGR